MLTFNMQYAINNITKQKTHIDDTTNDMKKI